MREDAMREAAAKAVGAFMGEVKRDDACVRAATAGADAELAQLERWAIAEENSVDGKLGDKDANAWAAGYMAALSDIVRTIRARDHWPK